MDNSCNFLIAKFGREEHLKQLQNGEIYFNAVQAYRDDGTVYRGDPMEGKIPIDPAKDVKIVLAFLVLRLLKLSDNDVSHDIDALPIFLCSAKD